MRNGGISYNIGGRQNMRYQLIGWRNGGSGWRGRNRLAATSAAAAVAQRSVSAALISAREIRRIEVFICQ